MRAQPRKRLRSAYRAARAVAAGTTDARVRTAPHRRDQGDDDEPGLPFSPSDSLPNVKQVKRAGEIHKDETLVAATGVDHGDAGFAGPRLGRLEHPQREIIKGFRR